MNMGDLDNLVIFLFLNYYRPGRLIEELLPRRVWVSGKKGRTSRCYVHQGPRRIDGDRKV